MSNEFDIAIVGMAGRFPGAGDIDEFWQNLAAGVESICRLSEHELLESGVPQAELANPSYVKAAPLLEDPGRFDAGFFGYSPTEARSMDPQHRILLELAHAALEHAGYDPERYPGRVGVFTGSALNTYFMNPVLAGRFTDEYIPTLIGNDKDFLSTRISYKLNLKGPSITVQTACSTSLVAVHLARNSLLSGETDMALAGAVSVRVPHRAGYRWDGSGVVSRDGHVRAFDANANGTVFGSGAGIVVLKRMADALSDGDTIHAVIRGSAVNNDGSEKAGYTAPSVASQADAVAEALGNAGIEADSIGYVEAHGSGTPVGDPIEVQALTKAFLAQTRRRGYCALGSVKTNIGHLDAAAGVAGMIKTVLALEHRQIPPSLHFTAPNSEIDFAATPFYVNTQLAEWVSEGPRRAGVMATGMGGTNAHVVLEEAPQPEASSPAQAPHLLVLSAKTETALERATERLRAFLESHPAANMSDVAHTLQLGRRALPYRRCLVVADRTDALAVMAQPHSKRMLSGTPQEGRRPIVFLLPGVGDHYVGMGHGLYEEWPRFKETVDRCAAILAPHLGLDIRGVLYPASRSWQQARSSGIDLKKMLARAAGPQDREAEALNRTRLAQAALFTVEYATAMLWRSLGIVPDAVVGHSLGEYVAACLSGVMTLEDALRLVATRARLAAELPEGGMLAVTLGEAALAPLLPPELSISLVNGPELCVVGGPADVVARFERTLDEKNIISRRVRNAHAFHTKMLDPIVQAFEREVRHVRLGTPSIPCISNVTGTWITPADAADPAYWSRHATNTARFADALQELWQLRDPIVLEAGPGRTLGVLAMQHPARRGAGNPLVLSSLRQEYDNQPDSEVFSTAIGTLWLAGADIRWDEAQRGARRTRLPLPTYPFEGRHYWIEPPRSAAADAAMVRKNADRSTWLYVPSWKRALPRTVGFDAARRPSETRTCLLFADENGFTARLTASLRAAGHVVFTVQPGERFRQTGSHSFTVAPANPRHYDDLVRALPAGAPSCVVHAWSLGERRAAADRAQFALEQAHGFYSLLYLARALAAHRAGQEVHLFALSSNVHDVCGTEDLAPEKSTVLGPCMVIGQEYPNVRVRSIDLDPAGEPARDAAHVLAEILNPDASLLVAHRNGQRWVRAYERVTADVSSAKAATLREGGVYLITGGLGKIGVAISEYLAATYRAKLVLVGRAELPGRDATDAWFATHGADDPTSARLLAIRRIESLGGEVLYVSANAGNPDAMRDAVGQAYARFGTLHGVIHGAGIVGDEGYREIERCETANCERHFEAKAHGALALEQALEGRPLDFCLLFSSLAAVLGGIGQAAYASSNLFLDAIARRHRHSVVPWLSVNWDVWRLNESDPATTGLGMTLKELGMNAAEATAMLETVLAARHAGQLVVSTGNLDARIDQWLATTSLSERTPVAPPRSSGRQPLKTGQQPRDEVEQQVARVWEDALELEEVGINESFARLGGHSLLAVRIVTQLRKAFQIDLPVRALFDTPTVAELAAHIKERLVADIAALSEEEAQRLVSNG